MIAAKHGTTNAVQVDETTRRVIKRHLPGPPVLWRSRERECSALIAAAPTGLAPRLISVGDDCLVLELLAGKPFPEALAGGDPIALARVAGTVLRRVHQCVPTPLRLPDHHEGTGWANAVGSLIERLTAALRDAEPDLDGVLRTVTRLAPALLRDLSEPGLGFVHGDFGGANVLDGPAGVVDWEWAHLGDPDYDLARHVWLREVGHDHRLYAGQDGAAAFFEGYGRIPDRSSLEHKVKTYGIVLALGHAVAAVHRDHTPAAYVRWLEALPAGRIS